MDADILKSLDPFSSKVAEKKIHLRTQQLNKEQIKEMMTKLLADIKEGGKIASLTNIDERIYNKAISRLKTLIRDSLVRYK